MTFEIVGGGLAGLAAATVLARQGARVRVFEKRRYPCVKLCGEFLSPEGLAALARVSGVAPAALERSLALKQVSRFAWISRRGRELELELQPAGWSVRRDVLDPWLAGVASGAGADVRLGEAGPGEGGSGEARRLWATGKEHEGLKSRYFAVKGYCRELADGWGPPDASGIPDSPGVRVARDALGGRDLVLYQLRGGYIGFTRMAGGELSYCALLDRRRLDADWRFASWAQLRDGIFATNARLREWAPRASSELASHVGAARFDFRRYGPVRSGRWFAGDAAQLLPPFVGDGMAMALEGGELAGWALWRKAGAAEYAGLWEAAFGSRVRLARLLHPILWTEALHEPLLWGLRRVPGASRWIYEKTRGRAPAPL